MKPLIAGNWKMNGRAASLGELDQMIARYDMSLMERCDLMLCPPFTLVTRFADRALGTGIGIGGQDCHVEPAGAHTGDISAEMLADAGARAVILGHSERRADHAEASELVYQKVLAAHRAGLTAIVCVGETAAERHAGQALTVVGAQMSTSIPDRLTAQSLVVAYEPVWAIGTGLTPTTADVAEVHAFIRRRLVERFGSEGEKMRILYGGSVKPGNARELLAVPNVNGALVGGASLKAADFIGIADGCP